MAVGRLGNRVAVVTGVSRPNSIGFAIARRLLDDGARVLIQSWAPHDHESGLESAGGPDHVLAKLPRRVEHVSVDLADPAAPGALADEAVERLGALDIVVATHAHSANVSLDAVTADDLDRAWAVNARAAVLLAQALGRVHDARRPGGRLVLFTSGQHRGPMASEIPYAVSKGAIHQMTGTLADALADQGITVNTVNPGPVDTGWPSPELRQQLRRAFPAGRWGRPDDIAGVVAFLASDDAAWLTGAVLDVEGGFRRDPLL